MLLSPLKKIGKYAKRHPFMTVGYVLIGCLGMAAANTFFKIVYSGAPLPSLKIFIEVMVESRAFSLAVLAPLALVPVFVVDLSGWALRTLKSRNQPPPSQTPPFGNPLNSLRSSAPPATSPSTRGSSCERARVQRTSSFGGMNATSTNAAATNTPPTKDVPPTTTSQISATPSSSNKGM